MTPVQFTISDIFDLPARAGLLATGILTGGDISAPTILVDATGRLIDVVGVEFLTPRNQSEGSVTLLLSRESGERLRPGDVLCGPEDPTGIEGYTD